MQYGFVLPYGDARTAADLAHAAELAGWDGFFVWEPIWGFDAWVCLAAAAMRTERIRLGTMISPIPRMKPWKLASETVTLDHLSGGRVTLSVGLGAPDTGYEGFGEESDRKKRAELLDEGLDILTGLWNGQPFQYSGKHYTVKEVNFMPPPAPVQRPRIPIWVVGVWPREPSLGRALRYDGILPAKMDAQGKFTELTPADIRELRDWAAARRTADQPWDIVVEGVTPGADPARAAEIVRPWLEAGATWWIEAMWSANDTPDHQADAVRERILQGPPRA